MPSYNFKREADVYLVHNGSRYKLDVKDISMSQSFAEKSYAVKTLHNPGDYFEGSSITTAKAANFDFEIYAIEEADFTIVESLLISTSSFDIYVQTPTDVFKLEKCVMTNGSFVIERSQPLSIAIQGEASKLTRGATLAGTLQSRSATKTFVTNPKLEVTLGGASLTDIVSVTVELQNDIEWLPYETVNASLSVAAAVNTMYPDLYYIKKKILAGSITQYLADTTTSNVQTWNSSLPLEIKAGNGLSGTQFRGFQVGSATSTFTNRMGTGDVFVQNYDWRITDNSSSLATIFKYVTN